MKVKQSVENAKSEGNESQDNARRNGKTLIRECKT